MSFSADQLRELSSRIAEDPDSVQDLDIDAVLAVRKHIDPIGSGMIDGKKSYANMSIVNMRERYLRRLLMTSMVGHLYRMADEYEPEADLAQLKEKFERASRKLDKESHEYKECLREYNDRVDATRKRARETVFAFLNRNYNYNPDYHLKGSHSENKTDPERGDNSEKIKAACATAATAQSIDAKLSEKQDTTYSYLRSNMLAAYQTSLCAASVVKDAIKLALDPLVNPEDLSGGMLKHYKTLSDITTDMRKIAAPLAAADTLSAWKVDPPVDVFHHLDRYITNHYEQLREATTAFYDEKPDVEFAITYYSSHDSAEAARDYRLQHEGEFRNDVYMIESAAVTLLGPFKTNRDRLDFYNKNTEVMKLMLAQVESDHKLGKDLMEKQVRTKKRRNIAEAGPDDPALLAYARTMNQVRDLGAKKVLDKDQIRALEVAEIEAKRIREDYEVPDDAIQVDVFKPEVVDGKTVLTKGKFYTQAEAPLHMQEGSPYIENYQPSRADNEPVAGSYRTKIITARDGTRREIKVPIREAADDIPANKRE